MVNYFLFTLTLGIISYILNWNIFIGTESACVKNILKTNGNLLLTFSTIIIVLSILSFIKPVPEKKLYQQIILIISMFYIIINIIVIVNRKQVDNTSSTEITCVNILASIFNLILGIILFLLSIKFTIV